LQVSQLLNTKEQLEFEMAAQQAQADELAAALEAMRGQVTAQDSTIFASRASACQLTQDG
jgi:hypothetical protein